MNYRRKKFYNANLGHLVLVLFDCGRFLHTLVLLNLWCTGFNLSHRQFFLLFIHLDKCSRIFQTLVNYRCKKFYNASLGHLVLVQFDCGRFLHTLVLLNLWCTGFNLLQRQFFSSDISWFRDIWSQSIWLTDIWSVRSV